MWVDGHRKGLHYGLQKQWRQQQEEIRQLQKREPVGALILKTLEKTIPEPVVWALLIPTLLGMGAGKLAKNGLLPKESWRERVVRANSGMADSEIDALAMVIGSLATTTFTLAKPLPAMLNMVGVPVLLIRLVQLTYFMFSLMFSVAGACLG